jgi:protein tyrosine phosphatase (PTP) superfamily phosphohydrolase (DUF442 family)
MSSDKLRQILNFLPVSDTLGTAGQPTAEQFGSIAAAGYEVVINLAMPDSSNALPNEADLVQEAGMTYVHIPVVWESPTLRDLDRFFEVMDRSKGRRVFVHCALNMRVSCFVFLYRVIRDGLPVPEAATMMRRIWEPNPVWRRFLQDALRRHGLGDQEIEALKLT